MKTSPVRFFLVVSPHPAYVWAGLALLVALGAWTVRWDPNEAETPLGMLLLAQMFTAATGFCGAASRGRYDPLFVSGRARVTIALAHWVASSVPGWAAWGLVGVAQRALVPGVWPAAFRPRSLMALLAVSVLTWAATIRLPRLSGGVLWCAALFTAMAARESAGWLATVAQAVRAPSGWTDYLVAALVHTAVPFLWLERRAPTGTPIVLGVEGLLVAGVLAGAVIYLARRDYALVEES